jgi:hypothetical protein
MQRLRLVLEELPQQRIALVETIRQRQAVGQAAPVASGAFGQIARCAGGIRIQVGGTRSQQKHPAVQFRQVGGSLGPRCGGCVASDFLGKIVASVTKGARVVDLGRRRAFEGWYEEVRPTHTGSLGGSGKHRAWN